jgi:pyruvate/2-oxoglutarate dehydrogenase complex dihydrolipoamide dehydrogenase (E3) component
MLFDVLVIGGGPAGVTAALRASELGAKVALVERARLGGTCTNDGCVPTRVLARAARLAREAEQFPEFGLLAEHPVVDFGTLLKRTQEKVYSLHEKKQLIQHLKDAGVEAYISVGEARFASANSVITEGGMQLEAKKFILCAGGHARRLTFPGSNFALTHSDVWSLNRLPHSVILVGGAATGCQLASIFEAFGTRVVLLEVAPRILGVEDENISRVIHNAFIERGIEITTGIGGVERIEEQGKDLVVWYAHQDQVKQASAEAVIMATGWPGNAEGLNLPAAGVQSERGYVVVDEYLRTSAPHIFAAGDITGRMMLVQSAGYEARVAAENAVFGIGQPYTHKIVPHGGFTDPEYGSVGLTEERARALEPDCVVAEVPFSAMDRAVIDGHIVGSCKLIVSRETHRILGAHVVGEQALEIIQLIAAGMAADMWVEQLADLELAYPTYTAIIGLAARNIVRELGVMPLAPEWRALGRPHASEWERSPD